MIITQRFIDSLLGRYNVEPHVKETAYSLIGMDHHQAHKKLSLYMQSLEDLDIRNDHVHLVYAMQENIDYGLNEGEKIRYFRRESGVIQKIFEKECLIGLKKYKVRIIQVNNELIDITMARKFENRIEQMVLF